MNSSDTRFQPRPTGEGSCLTCRHHALPHKDVECHHPQRPADRRKVVRWFAGCPQHKTVHKEDPTT